MSALTIDCPQDRDIPALASVHDRAWRAAYTALLPPESLEAVCGRARERTWQRIMAELGNDQRDCVRVARRTDGTIAGFAHAGPQRVADLREEGYDTAIYALYVAPEAQGGGLGTALMAATAEQLGIAGASGVTVQVLEGNHAARRFYARLQAQPIGTIGSDFRGTPITAVALGWRDPATLAAACAAARDANP